MIYLMFCLLQLQILLICLSHLLDRMEVIKLSGYTEAEKLQIAKNHLVKKQFERNGLLEKECKINDSALEDIIKYYTREAGVEI